MAYEISLRDVTPVDTAVVRSTVPISEIGSAVSGAFKQVWEQLAARGVAPTGLAFGRFGMHGDSISVEAGFSVPAPITGKGDVQPGRLPGGQAAVTLHVGPYDKIGPAYSALQAWAEANRRQVDGDPWEIYLTPPDQQPQKTEVVFPLRPVSSKQT